MSVQIKRGFISDAIAACAEDLGINEDDAFMHWFYSTLFDVEIDDVPVDEIVDGAGGRKMLNYIEL